MHSKKLLESMMSPTTSYRAEPSFLPSQINNSDLQFNSMNQTAAKQIEVSGVESPSMADEVTRCQAYSFSNRPEAHHP